MKLDKKLLIILAIGFAGMAFLLLSELWSGKDKSADTKNAKSIQTADSVSYSEDLERRLTDIISSINGAGKTKVMVTLESGLESVYADRETIRNGKTAAGSSDRNESYESDREYIVIQTDEGGEGGLVIKVIQPRVGGRHCLPGRGLGCCQAANRGNSFRCAGHQLRQNLHIKIRILIELEERQK